MLVRTSFALLLASAPLVAQFDFDLEKRSSARLGDSLDLEVVGAPPLSILLIVPSGNAGPTPLPPPDPRVLAVGTDLLGALSFAVTDAAGGATYSLPLPNTPSLSGFTLHWQTATLLFGATLLGELSNDVVTLTGLPDTGVVAPATLGSPRGLAAAIVDTNNNASQFDVLITGGGAGTLTNATGLATTELWDYRRMRRIAGPTMNSARALHLAVRLNDGRVLLIGGADAAGNVLASCEIYDPTTNSFTPTGAMSTPRILHAACLLANGRVLVAGGTSTLMPDVAAAIGATLNTAEVWNPATGTWTTTANIGGRRLGPALTLLPSGQAMISGGVDVTVFIIPIAANSTTAVQFWNPATGTWSPGPSMAQRRAGHHYNQVTLADGRILMSGGVDLPSLLAATSAAPINGAELYNPASNSWQTANMPNARALHTATRLADGRVVACGGAQGTLLTPVPIAFVDVFNPTTNTWTPAPNLTVPRGSHVAQALPDGTLILFGGQGPTTTLDSIETLRF